MEIGKLGGRTRRTFTDLLHAIAWGSLYYDSDSSEAKGMVEVRMLGEKEEEKIYNLGRSFSELKDILHVSSRTLARYLKICERHDLVVGYRFGKAVRYFLTEKGEELLQELLSSSDVGHTILLEPLAILSLFYPQARFVKNMFPKIIINDVEIHLHTTSKMNITYVPEGKVYRLFLKLLHGLGYEIFSLYELHALGIEIDFRLSSLIFRRNVLEKIEEAKKRRGIVEKPFYKLKPLIDWARLMTENIDKYYHLIRDKESLVVSKKFSDQRIAILVKDKYLII